MKKYEIPNASKLKESMELMKNPIDAHKVQLIASVWSTEERKGSNKRFRVLIELGRKACLCRLSGGDMIVLGEMHLGKTREFVKGLKETNESS